MSLDWTIDKIKDYQSLCWELDESDGHDRGVINRPRCTMDGERHVLTWSCHLLIFMCLTLGMSGITEKNVDKYYKRLRFYEKYFGCVRRRQHKDTKVIEDDPFTEEEVHKYIGLWTNASEESDAAWKKRMWDSLMRNL